MTWESVAGLAIVCVAAVVAWSFFLQHMEEREKTDREAALGEEMTERHLIDRQAEIARAEIDKPPTPLFSMRGRVQQVTGSRTRTPRVAIDVEHAAEVAGSVASKAEDAPGGLLVDPEDDPEGPA